MAMKSGKNAKYSILKLQCDTVSNLACCRCSVKYTVMLAYPTSADDIFIPAGIRDPVESLRLGRVQQNNCKHHTEKKNSQVSNQSNIGLSQISSYMIIFADLEVKVDPVLLFNSRFSGLV